MTGLSHEKDLSQSDITDTTAPAAVNAEALLKPVHTIILDTSPLILNTPSLSTLLGQSQRLFTTPSVISEIRDKDARSRIETLYLPFITLRTPKTESVKFVREFARKTGDAAVLSNTDIEIVALAYDIEYERNGGDWRLRRVPGQKRVNGSPPPKNDIEQGAAGQNIEEDTNAQASAEFNGAIDSLDEISISETREEAADSNFETHPSQSQLDALSASEKEEQAESSESGSDGWITPSNIKKHMAKDSTPANSTSASQPKTLQVATITGDFAMQNVLLQINLNLLSPVTCERISNIKQTILRCHGCFATTRDMTKQFCARCGKPTLTRVSCTTNDKGEVKLHLKKNMQWNNKGNVFSVPKPVSGTSNQKWQGSRQGGGKGGWGMDLVLAEDQKEYVRAMTADGRKRGKERDLMDEDFLPGILTGDRGSGPSGRPKVGGGRNINSKKR